MKKLLLVLLLCFSLASCHKDKGKKRHHSVMTNQKSLVNSWFGKDHFEKSPQKKDESMNKASPNESVEIDAGKMQKKPAEQNDTPPSTPTSQLDHTDGSAPGLETDSQIESESIVSDSMEIELNDAQPIQDEITSNASETATSDSAEFKLNEIEPIHDSGTSLENETEANVAQ